MGLTDRIGARAGPAGAGKTASAARILSESEAAFAQRVREVLYARLGQAELPPLADAEAERKYFQQLVRGLADEMSGTAGITLSQKAISTIITEIVDGITGLGKIQSLIDDPAVSEVMVNGPRRIYYERGGKVHLSDIQFGSNDELMNVIARILAPLGRRCDVTSPLADARLKDGSRVNVVIPPLALNGATVTIRKFGKGKLSIQDLIAKGSLTDHMAFFIESAVACKINAVVSGGTGSGKTTMLNTLSGCIPDGERVITVEDAAELRLQKGHVVRLESRPANLEGRGQVTIRDLVRNCLRMRPDRIVVGECRGGEALDMLQAMNTGHEGSMTTLHANSSADVIARMETMVLMAGVELPIRNIREQVASALEMIVHVARIADGSRRTLAICEVCGLGGHEWSCPKKEVPLTEEGCPDCEMSPGKVRVETIYEFCQEGLGPDGKVIGRHVATGYVPTFLHRFLEHGVKLPDGLFGESSVQEAIAAVHRKKQQEEEEAQRRIEELLAAQAAEAIEENPLGKRLPWRDAVSPPALNPFMERTLNVGKPPPAVTPKQQVADAVLGRVASEGQLERGGQPIEKAQALPIIQKVLDQLLDERQMRLPFEERRQMTGQIADEVLGLGPIQVLLEDPEIKEVMINGPNHIYIERGHLERSTLRFRDDAHGRKIIQRIISPLGRTCDELHPTVDARLKDGSRVNALIPPIALCGPTITIRKFSKKPLPVEALVRFKSLSEVMAQFLDACVKARLNIIVSGGTGSGKTTLLNALSGFIHDSERIVTVEDAAELQLIKTHVVRLEARPANMEGKGAVSIRDLVKNSFRMAPERIIVGECRGGETLDMLQAMNTGKDGSMTTAHANSPRDLVGRIETMVMMAGLSLPVRSIREQIASAIHLVVQQSRLRDGSRKITYITEIAGMDVEKCQVILKDIFLWDQKGIDREGKVVGDMVATGHVPRFFHRFVEHGMKLPEGCFGPDKPVAQVIEEYLTQKHESDALERARITEIARGYPPDEPLPPGKKYFRFQDVLLVRTPKAAPTPGPAPARRLGGAEQADKSRTEAIETLARKAVLAVLDDPDYRRVLRESRDEKAIAEELILRVRRLVGELAIDLRIPLSEKMKAGVIEDVLRDTNGFGPIQPLLDDPKISEVMVNGPHQIFYESGGRLNLADIRFQSNDHLQKIIDKIVSPLGRRCDALSPMVDARLPDGSRVNGIIPPISLVGPVLTIRKFSKKPLSVDRLVEFGALTAGMAAFLRACVEVKLNVVVSGGTGSGKTTMLNALSGFIPDGERIVTAEDAAELRLAKSHVVSLESRPANAEGRGQVTIRDLIKNCLRMRPDRIVVGECRGGEALDMLQAMNTGHEGSMTTGHANTPEDMIARMEVMVMMSGMQIPSRAIREQLAAAIDVIVQQSRFHDGSRKVTHISYVHKRLDKGMVEMEHIFLYEREGLDPSGKVLGRFVYTGVRPGWLVRIKREGLKVPDDCFGAGTSFSGIVAEMEDQEKGRPVSEAE